MHEKSSLSSLGISTFIAFIVLCIGSLIQFNGIIGPHHAYFAGINCMGSLASLGFASSIALGFYIIKAIFLGCNSSLVFLLHIPTICSFIHWRFNNALVRIGIPLVCMILFLLHPVGLQATPYALFWLIPVVLFRWSDSLVFCAVANTFTMHAVGSVLYVYCLGVEPQQLIALMPIVCIERIVFASGMIVIAHCANALTLMMQKIVTSLKVITVNHKQ